MFKPSLDIYQDNNRRYHILLWYSPLNKKDKEERKFINIVGGN